MSADGIEFSESQGQTIFVDPSFCACESKIVALLRAKDISDVIWSVKS